MGWQLAPGTGYCEVGGELVFLDLARDKYLALRGDDRAAFERLRMRKANDSEAMGRLVNTGLIARCDTGIRLEPTKLSLPDQDLSAKADERPTVRSGVAAARSLYWARRAMRPERIAATIAWLSARKRKLGVPGAEDMVCHIAAAYAGSRWLVPVRPRCLIDALALDHLLLSRGLSATLVFGVRLNPFGAHCWLQTPESIVSGTAAEARNFAPILAIGP